jgi:hypothetical protein
MQFKLFEAKKPKFLELEAITKAVSLVINSTYSYAKPSSKFSRS